jgi:hypothetical protein
MELQKALSTLKAVCDDSVANGRFRTIDEVSAVTDAYNTIVGVCNYAVAKQKEEQAYGGEIKEPTPDAEPSAELVESES